MRFVSSAVILMMALIWAPWASAAKGGAGAPFVPVMEAGANFHSGDTGKSLTGAMAYFATFRAEPKRGIFRPSVAADLSYTRGEASIGAETPAFTMMGAGFLGGVHIFPAASGRLQPFFGGSGILAWNILKLPTPPSGVEANTQGLAFGYEISAGVDLRFGSVEGRALRIHGGLWNVSTSLGGVSGFQLTGFRLSLGVTY